MARLLRLGRKTINLDLVFEIDDYGDRLRIFYGVGSSDTNGIPQPSYAELDGLAAERLRAWINEHALTLVEEAELDDFDADTTEAGQRRIAHTNPDAAAGASAGDEQSGQAAFYGAARIRQLRGAGSEE